MRIGPYDVLAELGRGGMGVVYRVRTPTGLDAALKLLMRADDEANARFERERRLLASLGEEQGFVGLLDAGNTSTGPWIVMPYVPGGTLRKRLETGRLGVEETVALGVALARALGAAHERGIVHRDVKPENILYTASGRPLLADLGLAKHFDPNAGGGTRSVRLTREGTLKGTAAYMAPEQIEDPTLVGPPADVFSLGAVLHECLSGRPAFHGESVLEVLAKVTSGSYEALTAAPPWLATALARALTVDPRERFPDGGSFARALGQHGGKDRRPGAFVPLALGAALGAVSLGGAWLALGRKPVTAAPPPAPPPARPAPPSPSPPGLAPAPATPKPDPARRRQAEELDRAAERKADRDDYDGVVADETKAIDLDPSLAVAWARRALARLNKNDLDGTISDATHAIDLDPTIVMAWGVRGAAHNSRGDFGQAIADETRAIALDPKNVLCWYNRGSARGNKGEADGAISDETRAIELQPDLVLAWAARGRARNLEGDWDGAIADATRALELAPRLSLAWRVRGRARLGKGDTAGAVADDSHAIEASPGDPSAWADRGFARVARGELKDAISDFEQSLKLAPNGPDSANIRQSLADARKRAR